MRRTGPTILTRVRWGGGAAAFAGLSYAAAGYLHKPGVSGYASALVSVLSVATPALFLAGLLGLRIGLPRAPRSATRSAMRTIGFVVGCLGAVLGAVEEIGHEHTFLGLLRIELWWWALLFGGLTLMGLSALPDDAGMKPRILGSLVLASSALGWVSLLTDPAFSGVLVPTRSGHVASAALFCLSCVAWGWGLYRVGSRSLPRSKPQARLPS